MMAGLVGCTSKDTPKIPENSLAERTVSTTAKGAFKAAQGPLVDLNITRDEIPPHLADISKHPYALPAPLQCKVLKEELAVLDDLLGPDMGALIVKEDGSLISDLENIDVAEEGAGLLESQAIDFVASKVSIIPLRGVVRQITGASKHEKELTRAYQAGKLRRAYLKGLSSALKCQADKTKKT